MAIRFSAAFKRSLKKKETYIEKETVEVLHHATDRRKKTSK